jgi:outer membrane protein assembly factor BamB
MYGRDRGRSFTFANSDITPDNAERLVPALTFTPGDTVSASPAVVDDVVYIGSWDGSFYALDQHSGALRWVFQVDCDNAIVPVPPRCVLPGQDPPPRFLSQGGLITSSAAVVDGRVYFAAGKTMYALRQDDGRLLWKIPACGNPDDPDCVHDTNDPLQIYSSPTVFANMVFYGMMVNGADKYRGGIVALNATNGKLKWRFEIDPKLNGSGHPILNRRGLPAGGLNRGCGNTFSSPTVDPIHGLVSFGTSDCHARAEPPYHETVLTLDAHTGRFKWASHPPGTGACDDDFGATANLIVIDRKPYFGIGGKDGTYYVLRANTKNASGKLLFSVNVVFGGSDGGFIGTAAFDGHRVYGGTAFGDGDLGLAPLCDPGNPRDTILQDPSMHAIDLASRSEVWSAQSAYTFGATSVGHGVVFEPTAGLGSGAAVNVFDAAIGGAHHHTLDRGAGQFGRDCHPPYGNLRYG